MFICRMNTVISGLWDFFPNLLIWLQRSRHLMPNTQTLILAEKYHPEKSLAIKRPFAKKNVRGPQCASITQPSLTAAMAMTFVCRWAASNKQRHFRALKHSIWLKLREHFSAQHLPFLPASRFLPRHTTVQVRKGASLEFRSFFLSAGDDFFRAAIYQH